MTRLLHAVAIACALAATAGAQPAQTAQPAQPAQPAPPTQDPKVEAKRLFDEATERYKLGAFTQALAGYESAYALFNAPAFLFNIAQCHFQLQNWDRAVFFFEGYLREQPEATNRALVEDLVREAKEREVAARQAEQRRLDLAKTRLEMEAKERDRFNAELDLLNVQLNPDPPIYKKWWFWTVVGGVVVAGVATTVALSTRETVLPSGSLGTVDQR